MDSRQEKIRLLSRMNRGRAAAPSFLAALSEALGEPVDGSALLPTSETDMLVETFRSGYQSAIKPDAVSYRRFFQAGERSLVVCLADCIAEKLPGERGLFFTKLSQDCGAVSLDLSVLLKHMASIIRLDGDSLSALSEDHKQGILIDHNPDDPKQTYEVVVWGDYWAVLALACDQ